MTPFRQRFGEKMFVRQNIFPITSLEADLQAKSLWKAGFAVEITNSGSQYYVWRAD